MIVAIDRLERRPERAIDRLEAGSGDIDRRWTSMDLLIAVYEVTSSRSDEHHRKLRRCEPPWAASRL